MCKVVVQPLTERHLSQLRNAPIGGRWTCDSVMVSTVVEQEVITQQRVIS